MAKRGPKPKENTVMAKQTSKPIEPMNDEPITEPVTEVKAVDEKATAAAKVRAENEAKLKKALAELNVVGIPVGVDSINDLNRQVQILEVRVLALEGKL